MLPFEISLPPSFERYLLKMTLHDLLRPQRRFSTFRKLGHDGLEIWSFITWAVTKTLVICCIEGIIHPVILLMAEILHHQGWWLSHYLSGFNHPRWCRISSINSMGIVSPIFIVNSLFRATERPLVFFFEPSFQSEITTPRSQQSFPRVIQTATRKKKLQELIILDGQDVRWTKNTGRDRRDRRSSPSANWGCFRISVPF